MSHLKCSCSGRSGGTSSLPAPDLHLKLLRYLEKAVRMQSYRVLAVTGAIPRLDPISSQAFFFHFLINAAIFANTIHQRISTFSFSTLTDTAFAMAFTYKGQNSNYVVYDKQPLYCRETGANVLFFCYLIGQLKSHVIKTPQVCHRLPQATVSIKIFKCLGCRKCTVTPEEVELNSTFSGTGGALPPGPQTPELNVSIKN